MSVENPFEGLSKEVYTLEYVKDPEGKPLKIKPKTRDTAMFFIIGKTNNPETEIQKVSKLMLDLLKRTYPAAKTEDLEAYIARNFGILMQELSIFFGFATRERIEEAENKVLKKLTGQ